MKTTKKIKNWVLGTISLFALQSQAQFFDNYSNSTVWTKVGLQTNTSGVDWINLSNGTFNYNLCGGGSESRVYRTHNLTLDFDWRLDMEFTPTAALSSGPAHMLASLTAGILDPVADLDPNQWGYISTNQDAIAIAYVSIDKTTDETKFRLFGQAKNNNNTWISSPVGIQLNLNSTYYVRLERLDETHGRISVFSDISRQQLIGTECFDIPVGVTSNLTHLQHGNIIWAGTNRELSASIDNTTIQNNIINPGSISGNQNTCAGSTPGLLSSVSLATTTVSDLPILGYEWEYSTNGGVTWNILANSNIPSLSPTLTITQNTLFRRAVLLACNARVYTNNVTISMIENYAGTITGDQSFCASFANPATIVTNIGASIFPFGTPSYQWLKSENSGTTWTQIPGANGDTYDPPFVYTTTWYRRDLTNFCGGKSNVVKITLGTIQPGTIVGDQILCPGNSNPELIFSTTAGSSSPAATLIYQWERSTTSANGPWIAINASNVTYDPTSITQTTWYRRSVKALNFPCGKVYSNVVQVTLLPNCNQTNCDYSNSFTSNTGWTIDGNTMSIANGVIKYSATPDASYQRIYRQHNVVLGSYWRTDVEFTPTSIGAGGVGHIIAALTEGNLDAISSGNPNYTTTNQDVIGIGYSSETQSNASSGIMFYAFSKNDNNALKLSTKFNLSAMNTTYYLTLERLCTTKGRFTVYADKGRTTILNQSTFDIDANVTTNLAWVQHGNNSSGGSVRVLTGTIDNLCISNMNYSGAMNLNVTTAPSQCTTTVSLTFQDPFVSLQANVPVINFEWYMSGVCNTNVWTKIGTTTTPQLIYTYPTTASQCFKVVAVTLCGDIISESNTVSFTSVPCRLAGYREVGEEVQSETPEVEKPASLSTVSVYPNPSTAVVYIGAGISEVSSLEIYDIQGNKIIESQNITEQIQIDLSVYGKGMYLLKLTGNNINQIERILIQ